MIGQRQIPNTGAKANVDVTLHILLHIFLSQKKLTVSNQIIHFHGRFSPKEASLHCLKTVQILAIMKN